jgi:hypothetical protein
VLLIADAVLHATVCCTVTVLQKFRDGTIYTGKFTNGKPIGAGSFTFPSGIKQTGIYTAVKSEEDEQSYSTDTTAVKATTWRGDSVLVC